MTTKRAHGSRPAVTIDLVMRSPLWHDALPDAEPLAEAAARAALAGAPAPSQEGTELAIVLGDDVLVQDLNRRWRGRDAPTNVLSFASDEPAVPDMPLLLGDVVLACETLVREAAAQRKPLADHLRHLVVHGVLHLLGFDHVEDGDAEEMEALERRILAGLGVPDPYRAREGADG